KRQKMSLSGHMMRKDPDTFFKPGITAAPLWPAFGKALVSWYFQKIHLWKVLQNIGDNTFIFFRREGAGGVKEHSPRPEHGDATAYDLFLELTEISGPAFIPGFGYVRIFAEHAFSGTGSVNED